VNQALAYQALAMLARLFRYGCLNYHGSFVNLQSGRTAPIPIDPHVWARMQARRKGLKHPLGWDMCAKKAQPLARTIM
jgi:hypothetical protein